MPLKSSWVTLEVILFQRQSIPANLLTASKHQDFSDLGKSGEDCHKILDWIEQCFMTPPTQYRFDHGRQVKRHNPQYQSTEGTYGTQTNQTYNKQTYKHKNTANPLVYTNMGWLGDGSHRRAGSQDWHKRNCYYYPRDAMLARVIAIATCPSVCLSRAGIVSKRRKLPAWFLYHLVAPKL